MTECCLNVVASTPHGTCISVHLEETATRKESRCFSRVEVLHAAPAVREKPQSAVLLNDEEELHSSRRMKSARIMPRCIPSRAKPVCQTRCLNALNYRRFELHNCCNQPARPWRGLSHSSHTRRERSTH